METLLPFVSNSGIILLKDLVKRTIPDCLHSSILSETEIRMETSASSLILCTSSITIRDGVLFNPSIIKFEQIDGLGVWAP